MRLADNAKIALKKKASAFFFFADAHKIVLLAYRIRTSSV